MTHLTLAVGAFDEVSEVCTVGHPTHLFVRWAIDPIGSSGKIDRASTGPERGRVAQGGYPPRAPTDPCVRN
jgi:hypothetical protein